VQRCLINDLNPQAVERAISRLRANSEFVPLCVSALARARADWLYGINMTRAYTILGRNAGYQGVLSVGRVQTPVLGLVVRRDEEIENFVAKDFFEVKAHIVTPKEERFTATWQPSEACEPYQDEEGRLLHRPLADHVVNRIAGQPALVTSYNDKRESEPAPLPFSLSALQIEAAKRFGLSAQNVLDICQKLYETHKLITYPRSDSRYLPEEHFAGRHAVMNAIGVHAPDLLPQPAVNPDTRNRCWDDKKVDAHHAIIPTARSSSVNLTDNEAKVYNLVARQYLMQFCPDAVFRKCVIELEIANGKFVAKARFLAEAGWRTLLGNKERDEENDGTPLPVVAKDDFFKTEHLKQRIVQWTQVRVDFLTQIARQEAEFLASFNGWTSEQNTADLLALQRIHGSRNGKIGFTRTRRAHAESDVVVEDVSNVLRLVRRAWLNNAAFGFDIDGFAIIRNAFGALLQHACFFDCQMDLLGFDILRLSTHRGGIDIERVQNIRSGIDADGASSEFEVIIATVDLDTQTSLQLFDVVIKRPTEAQQASVVCRLKGNFTRIYIQTVPLDVSHAREVGALMKLFTP
jgi:hypothetical protein